MNPYTHKTVPLLVIISGPSGVGKDSVILRIEELGHPIHFTITATSRPKRPHEVHGKDYFFMTKDEFETMISEDALLEHALVYGDYKGVPKAQIRTALSSGKDAVMRVDVQGAKTLRKIVPEAVFIYLSAESESALIERLRERKTDSESQIALRMATARHEHEQLAIFDYLVINRHGHLDETCKKIIAIMESEKYRIPQKVIKI